MPSLLIKNIQRFCELSFFDVFGRWKTASSGIVWVANRLLDFWFLGAIVRLVELIIKDHLEALLHRLFPFLLAFSLIALTGVVILFQGHFDIANLQKFQRSNLLRQRSVSRKFCTHSRAFSPAVGWKQAAWSGVLQRPSCSASLTCESADHFCPIHFCRHPTVSTCSPNGKGDGQAQPYDVRAIHPNFRSE